MSWTVTLTDALSASPYRWTWILRVIAVLDAPGDSSYVASSLPGIGDPIIGRMVRVNGAMLKPGSWTTTLGVFSVELVGNLSTFKQAVTRGTFLELLVGRPEWSDADYEVVAVGQAQQLTGKSPTQATLTCRDLLSALRSRPTTTAGQSAVGCRFTDITTTLTAGYTVGDSTISIADISGFECGSAGTACLVTPTSGDPFIIKYTGVSGLDLTGVGATASHGTTASNAASGDVIQPILWIEGHPLNLIRRVMLSIDGSGAHGYDDLPEGDGLSLDYYWFDHADTNTHYLLSEPSMSFELAETEPIEDPWGWAQGWLAKGGFYLTIRQGLLTGRSAQPSTTSTIADAAEITDDDIELGGASWEAWDQDSYTEAANVTVTSNNLNTNSSGVENPATLPTFYRQDYDLTSLLYSNETTGRLAVVGRVWEAHTRIPERYALSCMGLRLAVLAPGDFVRITSRQIAGRLSSTLDGLSSTRGIVTQVSTDWGRGRVALVVLVYPTSDGQFP